MVTDLIRSRESPVDLDGKEKLRGSTVDQQLNHLSIDSSLQSPGNISGGYLDIHGSETNYLGATNWTAILDNVSSAFRRSTLLTEY